MVAKVKSGACTKTGSTKRKVAPKTKFYYRITTTNSWDDIKDLMYDSVGEERVGFEKELDGEVKWTEQRIAEFVRHLACVMSNGSKQPINYFIGEMDLMYTGKDPVFEVSLTPFKD